MKQEDKEILLKDLCARLPYDVYARRYVYTTPTDAIESVELFEPTWLEELYSEEAEFKPYLFPLSSMSKEQKNELCRMDAFVNSFGQICFSTYDEYGHELMPTFENAIRVENWLNKNNFDYRGLIPKGLAIDATELNIY